MSDPVAKLEPCSYADYLSWPQDERWEIIDGVPYDMTPGPSSRHQLLSGNLYLRLRLCLESGACMVVAAPFDVRLVADEATDNDAIRSVVQPDLSVVCEPSKIDDVGCLGAPDMVVEILSPTTAFKDQTTKLTLYERHGVGEVWLVNPERETVMVYILDKDEYRKPTEYRRGELIASEAVPAIRVELHDIFDT